MVLYTEFVGGNCGVWCLLLIFFDFYDFVEHMACGTFCGGDSSII